MSGSVAVRKRTRNGCLTCRRRRRKCDETRPKCQNCTEKQLNCRYGMQLVFRESNLLSLTAVEKRELERQGPTNYSDLRFVDAMEEDFESFELSSTEDDKVPTTRVDAEAMEESPPKESRNSFGKNHLRTEDYWGTKESGSPVMVGIASNHTIRTPSTYTTFSHETPGASAEGQSSQVASFHLPQNPISLEYLASPMSSPFSSHSSGFRNTFSFKGNVQQNASESVSVDSIDEVFVSTAQKYRLLQLFLEKSSSWLDLNRLTNSLAVELSSLARTCPPLLCSMLETAACQETTSGLPSRFAIVRRDLRTLALRLLEPDISQSSATATAETLLITSQLLTTELCDWKENFRSLSMGYGAKYLRAKISSQRTLCWAVARFDIAAAIISSLPTVADFEQYDISQLCPASEIQDAIVLCAKTVNLNLAPAIHSIDKRDEWSRSHTIVEDWQLHLITGVQPLLTITGVKATELEDTSTSFPVVIYTNRPMFFTSCLFHMSCLLLLQNRPHSLRRMKSTCLRTVVYHSVHLCGISKSNRLAWSWDPILVAALLFASKFLSYRGQQIEILQHLKELTGLTGWRTSKEIDRLQEHWRVGQ
ncbi:hypothetical protein N431DRAFT_540827 [Stipitochalara longipes BDJ]|nr:hypothetical protein N431DRAFT_540827 [Stipitochalara longipes BDJ]